MADENILPRDQNHVTSAGFENSLVAGDVRPGQIIVATGRIKVDSSGGGSGTVTDVSVVTANGFAGTVANSTTTPAITLTTTVTGLIKGDGTALSAASATTDYAAVAFKTISVSGQSDVVADSPIDTLTLVAGTNITITTNAGTDSITINASGSTGVNSVTGTANRITIGGTASDPTVDISTSYVGQATITTLGTIATGTWSATTIAVNKGGTGQTTYTDGQLLIGNTTGNTLAKATLTQGTGITITNGSGTITIAATGVAGSIVVGTTTITSGTNTRILYDNSGVLGEYTLTGSGTVVMMQTAPTFITSMTGPLLIGGSGTTGTQLTLQTTTGNGTTDALVIKGGNNGATTFATFTTGALTITTSGVFTTGTIELGAASDTTLSRSGAGVLAVEGVVIPSVSSTNTLTNKRITRRVTTTNAPGATPTTNSDNVDLQIFTGIATAITSMTTNLSGTPVIGDFLEIDFLDDGTARAITWGASFSNGGLVNLPTTTVISTMLRVLLTWQTTASLNKWVCVAVA